MSIAKSPDLERWLRGLNYSILGINLFFGDWIETAIDWILQPINYLSDWAENVVAWLMDLRDEIIAWIDYVQGLIGEVWGTLIDWASGLWDQIEEWWRSKADIVLGWIEAATEGLAFLKAAWDNFWTVTFPEWTSRLDDIRVAWNNFWTQTLPNLVDFSGLLTWWNSRLGDINDLIAACYSSYEALWAGWQEVRDKVLDFFNNPIEFIWQHFVDWFLGAEE